MKKQLTAMFTLIIVSMVAAMQSSAQVAAFNSLSLYSSNAILTTTQTSSLTGDAKAGNDNLNGNSPVIKQHLETLPSTGFIFGDNTQSKPLNILTKPETVTEPMAAALERWVAKELLLQQPKHRFKRK